MTTRGVLVSPEYPGRGGSGDSKRRRQAVPCPPANLAAAAAGAGAGADPFCAPAVPWLQPLPLAAGGSGGGGSGGGGGEPGCSRPTSGDGHTPVPPESSSPQTTEEPLSPIYDAE